MQPEGTSEKENKFMHLPLAELIDNLNKSSEKKDKYSSKNDR